jgi:hypothetical protein
MFIKRNGIQIINNKKNGMTHEASFERHNKIRYFIFERIKDNKIREAALGLFKLKQSGLNDL